MKVSVSLWTAECVSVSVCVIVDAECVSMSVCVCHCGLQSVSV
jgi:hypothetical protein